MNLAKIKKIIIIRWGSLGDLAINSAIFQDIYEQLPDREIHLMTEPQWADLFKHDPRFTKIITYPMRGVSKLQALKNWLKVFNSEKYDLSIDLQNNDRSRFLQSLSFILMKAPQWRVSTTDNFPFNIKTEKITHEMHALEVLQTPIKAIGLKLKHSKPVLFFAKHQIDEAKSILEKFGILKEKFVILVPGSSLSGKLKRWGAHNYFTLAKLLISQNKVEKIILLGSKNEIDLCEQLTKKIGDRCINLAGHTNLAHITTIVSLSIGVVSNDSGIAHIAAAESTPVVVIFGPTLATRVKPTGENIRTLQAPISCFAKLKPEKCMSKITPEMVIHALLGLNS